VARQCAQPQPPVPQPGMLGIGQASLAAGRVPAATPTIPGLESSLARLTPWHAGHSGVRSAVTNASKGLSQSRHWYSKIGMPYSSPEP
jgi:hypothetical protein